MYKPGTILARANAALKPHGFRLVPEPGVQDGLHDRRRRGQQRQRHVLRDGGELSTRPCSMTLVLPSGTVLDTSAPDAEEHFATAEPAMASGLMEIRDAILAEQQYVMKRVEDIEKKNQLLEK